MSTIIDILALVATTVVICVAAFAIYIRLNTVGTFKFDNNGDTYRCRLDFNETIDDVERKTHVFLRVQEADLSLPGERPSQQ